MRVATIRKPIPTGDVRPINEREIVLLEAMLRAVVSAYAANRIMERAIKLRVRSLLDYSGCGIAFMYDDEQLRHYQGPLSIAEYVDGDGARVSIALNVDGLGDPYELEFWKYSLAPIVRYPAPSMLRIRRPVSRSLRYPQPHI